LPQAHAVSAPSYTAVGRRRIAAARRRAYRRCHRCVSPPAVARRTFGGTDMRTLIRTAAVAATVATTAWLVRRWYERRRAEADAGAQARVATWENEGGALAPARRRGSVARAPL
jgi:hypothetical protein